MQRFHRTAAENSLLLQGQQTNDYAEFQRLMSETDPTALRYLRARPQIIESTFDRVRYGVYNRSEYRMLWG